MNTRTWLRSLVVPVIGLTLVGACGSSKSSVTGATSTSTAGGGSPTTGTPTASIPTASVDQTAAGLVPAPLKSKGSLTVAMDATYPPDEFIASDGHTIIGMDADLMRAIGQVLGLKVSLTNATFDTIIPGILSGKYDVGASSFTDSKDREKQLDFVTYFTAGEGYYVAANSTKTFDGLDALCGHTVAVESGTTEETDATNQTKTCQSAGKAAVNVLTFKDQNAANLAISSGRAELGFSDSQVADYIVQQSNGQFKLTGTPFSTAPYGLAVPKNGIGPAFLAAVKNLMQSGIYAKILDKWGISAGAITNPVINGATS